MSEELPLDFTTQPHDAYFKSVFQETEQAAAFFRSHLPPALVRAADWDSLQLLPGSFVDSSLRQSHSDLLFAVQVGGGAKLHLYLLFEHQTSPDAAMPLRLLSYMLEFWKRHFGNDGLPLPPVLPFVLHQGPEEWKVSTQFEDLIHLPGELGTVLLPYVPKFRHALLDLSRYDPAAEEPDARTRVVLQLMKLARQQELQKFFRWLLAELASAGLLPPEMLRLLMVYAMHVEGRIDEETIYRSLAGNETLEEQAMTIAQQLISKGEARGEAKGEAKGKAEGEARGKVIGKLQMLQEMMGLPVSESEELESLGVEALQGRFEALQAEYRARYKDR